MELERSLKITKQQQLYSDQYCDELQESLKKMTKKKRDVEEELRSLQFRYKSR